MGEQLDRRAGAAQRDPHLVNPFRIIALLSAEGIRLPLPQAVQRHLAKRLERRVGVANRRRLRPHRQGGAVVEQLEAALRLGGIVRQQWQLVGERDRQPVEILGPAALEFEFDLAQRGLAIAGSNFSLVDHHQHADAW